jgi:uncharacterized protein YggE
MAYSQEQLKKVLTVVSILALVVGAYAVLIYARAYSSSVGPTSYRSFGVTGEGKVVVVPDVANFSFGLITQGGKDVAKLQADNSTKVNKAIDFLKESGVDEKDIKTTNYSINPRYQGYNCGMGELCPPAQIIGYEINQTIEVKVRKFDKVGDILAGVVTQGANSVSGLQFTVDDIKKLESEARGLAIKEAGTQAKLVAEAGGFGLGSLLSVDEMTNGPYPYAMGSAMSEAKVMNIQAPSIQAGSQEIVVRVNARYQIR